MKPSVAENIKVLRLKKKLARKELSAILSVTEDTIANWENGKTHPNSKHIKEMALLFEVDYESILDDALLVETPKIFRETSMGEVIYVDLPVSGGPLDGHYYKDAETTLLAMPGWTGEGYAFTVYGDSMSPVVNDGDIVVCKPVEGEAFAQGTLYMIETRNDGMTCKYIKSLSGQLLEIYGANPRYKPYTLQTSAVARIYEVKGMYRPLQRP